MEDASSVKFLVRNFNEYMMVDTRLVNVMEQFHEIYCTFGQFVQYNLQMDESISVSSIMDKLPPSWRDFKNILNHNRELISLLELGNSLRIEEDIRVQEKEKKHEVSSSIDVNVMEEGSQKGKNDRGKKRPSNNKK